MKMDNAEEVFHFLEEFSKRKPKTIPQELNDYLAYVARTGDPVYQWALVKALFKEKLLNVITEFYDTTPGIDIPPYPNVDPFNYDTMKNSLLERLDSFTSAPFTVQRICELLTYPRKQYNRVDKFMRAIEKNILVVSTREPGIQRRIEAENGEPMEPVVNGSDNNSEYNVDVEMEDMSWKENAEPQQSSEPQPSSSDTHISVDDIEARLKAKQETPMDTQDKVTAQYESVTPPELNVITDEQQNETKAIEESSQQPTTSAAEEPKVKPASPSESPELKDDQDMTTETCNQTPPLVIPEIKVDDAEMTEQKLSEQASIDDKHESRENDPVEPGEKEPVVETDSTDSKPLSVSDDQQITTDESSSDSNPKEEMDNKIISDVQTSSEESSSSSDNTDGNSNSPKAVESNTDIQEESNQSDSNMDEPKEDLKQIEPDKPVLEENPPLNDTNIVPEIQTDNYSISDVKSELPQPSTESKVEDVPSEEQKDTESNKEPEPQKEETELKVDSNETENEVSTENTSS